MNPFGVSNVSFFLCKSLHKSPITIKGSHFSPLRREQNKCFEEKLNTAYGINCNGGRNLLVGLIQRQIARREPPCGDNNNIADLWWPLSDVSDPGGWSSCVLINAGHDQMLSPSCCQLWVGGSAGIWSKGCKFQDEREAKGCKSRTDQTKAGSGQTILQFTAGRSHDQPGPP